ncbi:hypothetical protein N798_09845 [Knoellia flava TL1]|uniref:Uncharacterized protein n=1 Tax=Knoellia flava TL1 TaxID=1385518 RepID=A0ABR4XE77_9MICO|nr:hypothetical protein N798_09845 [Knoellia flava TL1]
MDLAVELEHRVAAEDEGLASIVAAPDTGHGLGLGPREEQGDVGRLEGPVDLLGGRDDGVLVDVAHVDVRIDAGGTEGRKTRG